MKKLSDATFIIPLRIDSADRVRNIITTVGFILETFDAKVIIKEVDSQPLFKEYALPQITEYLEEKVNNLTHIFEESQDSVFYRMQIINEMLSLVETDIVFNYDCDVLLKEETYEKSAQMIRDGYDIVYPYGFGNYQKQVHVNDEIVSEFLNELDFSILDTNSNIYDAQYGHVQVLSKKSYIDAGMENENFKGSSPEDKERFYRFTKLGYNVGRVGDFVYHLEHSRGENSWPISAQKNPYMQNNFSLWEELQKMTKEQLREYYNTQPYLQKYK
jgi:virulence-associated protein VapD